MPSQLHLLAEEVCLLVRVQVVDRVFDEPGRCEHTRVGKRLHPEPSQAFGKGVPSSGSHQGFSVSAHCPDRGGTRPEGTRDMCLSPGTLVVPWGHTRALVTVWLPRLLDIKTPPGSQRAVLKVEGLASASPVGVRLSLPAPPGGSWGGIVSSPPESPAHGHLLRLGGVSLPFVPAPPPHHPLLLSCRQSSPYSTGHYSISRAFSSSHLQSPPCRVGDLRRSQTACGRLRGAVLQLPQTVRNCLQGLFSIKASAPPRPPPNWFFGGIFFPIQAWSGTSQF